MALRFWWTEKLSAMVEPDRRLPLEPSLQRYGGGNEDRRKKADAHNGQASCGGRWRPFTAAALRCRSVQLQPDVGRPAARKITCSAVVPFDFEWAIDLDDCS